MHSGDWVVISHLPLFALKDRFTGYHYVNTLYLSFSDEPMIISAESGLFAITEDLPEDQNHIFVPTAKISEKNVKIVDKVFAVTLSAIGTMPCLASAPYSRIPPETRSIAPHYAI